MKLPTLFFSAGFLLSILSFAEIAGANDARAKCPDAFRSIAGNGAIKASSASFDEIGEIALWTDSLRKLHAQTNSGFWSSSSAERTRLLDASVATGEISKKLHAELTGLLKVIDEGPDPQEVYRILSLPNERAVSTALRTGMQTSDGDPIINRLSIFLENAVAKRCKAPVTRECEAATLEYLVASDRRTIAPQDRAQKIESSAKGNFQVVESTRVSTAEASTIAGYLKNVAELKLSDTGRVMARHKERKSPPAELQQFIERLMVAVREADPNAVIKELEAVHMKPGQSQNPYTHFDGGPTIEVLVTFEGSRTWVQGADGRFFQISNLGDAALILTKDTEHPTAHLSPTELDAERVLLLVSIEAPKFRRKTQ
jgi:hypothetical protein